MAININNLIETKDTVLFVPPVLVPAPKADYKSFMKTLMDKLNSISFAMADENEPLVIEEYGMHAGTVSKTALESTLGLSDSDFEALVEMFFKDPNQADLTIKVKSEDTDAAIQDLADKGVVLTDAQITALKSSFSSARSQKSSAATLFVLTQVTSRLESTFSTMMDLFTKEGDLADQVSKMVGG